MSSSNRSSATPSSASTRAPQTQTPLQSTLASLYAGESSSLSTWHLPDGVTAPLCITSYPSGRQLVEEIARLSRPNPRNIFTHVAISMIMDEDEDTIEVTEWCSHGHRHNHSYPVPTSLTREQLWGPDPLELNKFSNFEIAHQVDITRHDYEYPRVVLVPGCLKASPAGRLLVRRILAAAAPSTETLWEVIVVENLGDSAFEVYIWYDGIRHSYNVPLPNLHGFSEEDVRKMALPTAIGGSAPGHGEPEGGWHLHPQVTAPESLTSNDEGRLMLNEAIRSYMRASGSASGIVNGNDNIDVTEARTSPEIGWSWIALLVKHRFDRIAEGVLEHRVETHFEFFRSMPGRPTRTVLTPLGERTPGEHYCALIAQLERGSVKALVRYRALTEEDKDEDGDIICGICREPKEVGDEVAVLPCGHYYDSECVLPWLEGGSRSCPTCRRVV